MRRDTKNDVKIRSELGKMNAQFLLLFKGCELNYFGGKLYDEQGTRICGKVLDDYFQAMVEKIPQYIDAGFLLYSRTHSHSWITINPEKVPEIVEAARLPKKDYTIRSYIKERDR